MKSKRAKVLRPVVIAPLIAVLATGAVWMGLRSGGAASTGAAATTQLFTVSPTTLSETVSASGTIAAADTEDLSFTVAGTVATVNVKAGQVVKKGQVLATVDSATLSSSAASAKATFDAAEATLSDDGTAGASSAQITNDQAAVTAAYASLISANSGLSGATLTSPIAGTIATMNLTVGEVLSSTGATGTSLSGTATGSGRTAASTSSSSSATGTGSASSATSSSSSASTSSTAQIEVVSSTYVVNLSVDTTTVGNLKDGQSATVTPTSASSNSSNSAGGGFRPGGGFPGGGFGGGGGGATGGSQSTTNGSSGTAPSPTATAASATGKVTSVSAIASTSSGVATFPVAISVTGTPTGFHIGASASTVITYRQLNNVLAVPTNAVTQSNGVSTVTVSTNGSTAPRTVTTGISSGGQTQILSGLSPGDQVVVTIPQRSTSAGGTSGAGGSSQFPGGGGFPGGGARGGATG